MLSTEQKDAIADLSLAEGQPIRVYPSLLLPDGTQPDLVLVHEDFLAGVLDVDHLTSTPDAKQITRSMSRTFDSNLAVSSRWHAYEQLVLTTWGFVLADTYPAQLIVGASVVQDVPVLNQLGLLWMEELRDLLTKLKVPVPEVATKPGLLCAAALSGAKPSRIKELVRQALLTRDYQALGRADFTYRSDGNDRDSIFGLHPPDEPWTLVRPEDWTRELNDDPAFRLRPAEKQNKTSGSASRREAVAFARNLQTHGVPEITQRTARSFADMLITQRTGLVPPDKKKTPEEKAEQEQLGRSAGWIPWDKITAVPGVPWIPDSIIDRFARFLAGGRNAEKYGSAPGRQGVLRDSKTGRWIVLHNRPYEWTTVNYARLESTFGLPDYNALRILEALLNLRQPKLAYEEKSLAVGEKADLIIDTFQEWLWRDPARRERVEATYNALFQNYATEMPDGSNLKFPGKSDEVELYPYQLDAVQKILDENNSLLAFDTGAGKTYIMIAAAMKLRQMKKSRKNMFVVPNNIVGQWREMFLRMYPDANLLVVDPSHFRPRERAAVLQTMRDGDWDGIIIAYSCLEQIPLSAAWLTHRKKAETAALEKELHKYSRWGPWHSARTALQNDIRVIEQQTARQIAAAAKKETGKNLTFDKLGITGFFLDEAHNFKNVPIRTALDTLGGLNVAGSSKCQSMLDKVRCVQQSRAGRGAVLATATPLSNSLADAYTMQRYIQPDQLRKAGLDHFDDWVKTFARPEFVCEIDVDTSRFRFVRRLARFFNIPELSRMFASSASFHRLEDASGLPELTGYSNILIDRGQELAEFMHELCTRTERIRAGQVPRTEDNMLKVSTEGRLGALDLRLVGKKQPYDAHSKLRACVESVLSLYRESSDATQIIFCDYSTPKRNAFNVYEELAKHLQEEGIPSAEIAFIHSYTTEARKLELYRKMNEGEIRILIGSTFKLGIGTNVQRKLKAVHHLDIPWRPADMVQREGRILRKGNTNTEVRIYRYISEGSFDAYSWQILERKQRFISQFLDGTLSEREASDIDDTVLTYAQVKALAISEPLMRDLAEKENELRRLRLLAANHVETSAGRRTSSEKLQADLTKAQDYAKRTAENAEFLKTVTEEEYTKTFREFRDTFTEDVVQGTAPLPPEAREVLGFVLSQPDPNLRNARKPFLFAARNGAEYRVFMGGKAAGNIRRIINFLKKFGQQTKKADENAARLAARMRGNEAALAEENPYPAQIAELEQQVSRLRGQIMERQAAD